MKRSIRSFGPIEISATRRRRYRDRFSRRLRLEPLEDRCLLAAYTVDSLADVYYAAAAEYPVDGHLTLREAIEAANRNTTVGDATPGSATETDTIAFAESLYATGPITITLAGQQLTLVDNVHIQGPGADVLSIDAGRQSRVIEVASDAAAALSDLTITGGLVFELETGGTHDDVGGGILNFGDLAIERVTITANTADSRHATGGGIFNDGTATITNSTISDNLGYWEAGAVYSKGTLAIIASTISGNSSRHTSAIRSVNGTLLLSGSFVTANSSEDRNATIRSIGTSVVVNSIIWGNAGRGLDNISGDSMLIVNSTVTSNLGGIVNYPEASLGLYNSIVADNIAESHQDTYPDTHTDMRISDDSSLFGDHNIIGVWDYDVPSLGAHSFHGTSVSPLDPGLSDFVVTPDGNWAYHLLPGSRALDAGDNTRADDSDGNPLTVDILGNSRIGNGTVDMGAVEGAGVPTPGVSYAVESLDMAIAADGILSFGEATPPAVRSATWIESNSSRACRVPFRPEAGN